ncbi:MAG: Type 1 glutamine amidotransferase-like domain-containing protein [bacterium]
MKHLFLTSAIGTPKVAKSIRAKLGHDKKLKTAFITTPIEVEDMTDDQWYRDDRSALTKNGFEFFDYTVTGKDGKDFENDLASVDAIYVSGGNTNYLLEQSQKSGFMPFIQNFVNSGKLYLGTSAGSIIAGPTLPPYLWGDEVKAPNLKNFSCYNLVNFTLLPHWGSDAFREAYLSERMSQIYSESNPSFILCNDNQYVEVVGDRYRIIDVRNEK